MPPRVRVLVLACAACTILHLPSSTAAPVSPPLLNAIGRAITSIFVQAAVSRGIAEDDKRTTSSLNSIEKTLTSFAERASAAFDRRSPSWINLWTVLGHKLAIKLLAGDDDAVVEVDPDSKTFKVIPPTSQPLYTPPPIEFPEKRGRWPSFSDQIFMAISAGLRVFRFPICTPATFCEKFPAITPSDTLSSKYRAEDGGMLITANSHEELLKMANLMCNWMEKSDLQWSGKAILEEGRDKGTWGPMCLNKDGLKAWTFFFFSKRPDQPQALPFLESEPGAMDFPITTDSMTQLVNGLWKEAASKPDYKGLPFEPERLIEKKVTQDWFLQEPDKVPKVSDLFKPSGHIPQWAVVPIPDTPQPRVPGRNVPPTYPGTVPGLDPGNVSGTLPGTVPSDRPDTRTGALPGTPPGIIPGTEPGRLPEGLPGTIPGVVPGTHPGVIPSDIAGTGTVAGVGSIAGTGVDARTGVGQDVNVVNQPSVHVANPIRIETGKPPSVSVPKLEPTPTAQMILKPLLDLLPGFRTWQPPAHQAECPRPTFQVFQHAVRVDAICDIAQQNRATMHATMMLVFGLAALLIVLSA